MPLPRSIRAHSLALALGATVAGLAGCATVDTAVVAEPGSEFALPLGKTASLNGSGVRITFKQVTDDSRCPVDVQCVWAGDARIELTISRSGSPDDAKILSITPPNNETTSGDLRIRFTGLSPAPRQADAGKQRAYVAQLVVTRG